ncbi:hypothetical protein AQI88_16785 [Streptomyces cellostaticus]|uniref:SH3b domain-containing protein n=1 Tax=Streptomyces cellostaticus TaxID=67285 RepID=A0A101NLS8_9ACTN|nr:SH3 domain-containing protein [Streptomyces cellostaticus]KUM95294.1 hypothetical protein AQI88_16785 [Streptomyces cellostaticus]GHI01821.1 hypothetical protein Scel_01420 [Streptomyces cellostaticus]
MIRRTLKSGLLATVAVLAFLPAAAGAAPASAATTPRPVPTATAQHPAQHPKHRTRHAKRSTHRVHHRRLRSRRVHHFVTQGMSYRRTLPLLGRVHTHGARLNVRSGPGTYYRVIGHRHTHRLLTLTCKTYGSGVYGNHTWYRLPQHRGYVSGRYVRTGRAVPWC